MAGCPDCGVIALRGPHVCEHGVTPESDVSIGLTVKITEPGMFELLLYGTNPV